MTRISKYLITLITLLTVLFSQSKIVNQKPITEQIHENIQKALLLNQFSEGSRPIDEIQQIWSGVNNDWKNYVRYTYEYNPAKLGKRDPIPEGLDKMTKFTPNGISWEEDRYTVYDRYEDGTWNTATTYKSADNEPVVMIQYGGPFYNGIATFEIRSYPDDDGFWVPGLKVFRTFNAEYLPIEIIRMKPDVEPTGNWEISDTITIEYSPEGEASCPDTKTWYRDPDITGTGKETGKITTIVPMGKEEYTYGQSDCTNDIAPYNLWNASPCNNTRTDFYDYDYDTANLFHQFYGVTNYNSDNCLASETTTYFFSNDFPFDKSLFWYDTPDGNYPNKSSTAYDNSETRLIRAEGSWWDGQNWNNYRRGLYAYEGMSSLDTEDVSLIPIGFELKQNYPNPFNPTTSISYELPQESNISIKIYNSLGHEIKTLVNEFKSVGQYQVTWDGLSNSGELVSDGTYFYQLTAGDFTQTRKMVLMK